MRPIKFRMWGSLFGEKPEMQEVDSYLWEEYGTCGLDFAACLPREECVLMQFIGLLDMDGKEIYEGDIVKMDYEGGEKIFSIGWEKYECQFVLLPANFKSAMGWNIGSIWTDIRVIGNIYENRELLKTEQLLKTV